MREVSRRPSEESAENTDEGRENGPDRAAETSDDFDEAQEADRSRGLELRTSREVASLAVEVKREISRAFEHFRREQEKFGDQVRSDAALRPRLERFLNFLDGLKREESTG